MVSRSHPTRAATPIRKINASRETPARVGRRSDASAAWLTSASGEQAQGFRRQGDGEFLPLGDREIAHQIGGEIGEDGDAGSGLRIEPRAAERSEEIETRNLRVELVLRCA